MLLDGFQFQFQFQFERVACSQRANVDGAMARGGAKVPVNVVWRVCTQTESERLKSRRREGGRWCAADGFHFASAPRWAKPPRRTSSHACLIESRTSAIAAACTHGRASSSECNRPPTGSGATAGAATPPSRYRNSVPGTSSSTSTSSPSDIAEAMLQLQRELVPDVWRAQVRVTTSSTTAARRPYRSTLGIRHRDGGDVACGLSCLLVLHDADSDVDDRDGGHLYVAKLGEHGGVMRTRHCTFVLFSAHASRARRPPLCRDPRHVHAAEHCRLDGLEVARSKPRRSLLGFLQIICSFRPSSSELACYTMRKAHLGRTLLRMHFCIARISSRPTVVQVGDDVRFHG